jgi:hypothetical protein
MSKVCYIIFAHSLIQTENDLDDMIKNIKFFNKDCDFVINHPNMIHPKIRTRHMPGELDRSNFIFGAFEKIVKELSDDEINSYDHFCLVSANQYFINKPDFEVGVNYVQFYNTDDWSNFYDGYNYKTDYVGFPLQQPYGRWDPKDLYKVYNLNTPMASNWECIVLTKESMLLCKENIDSCVNQYPNQDMISLFPGYMALMSGQRWEFPKHFGTYDPSNKQRNHTLFLQQVDEKYKEGYYSIKRVNYDLNCPIKEYIRNRYMK